MKELFQLKQGLQNKLTNKIYPEHGSMQQTNKFQREMGAGEGEAVRD